MRSKVDGEDRLNWCDSAGGERHAGGSNCLSEGLWNAYKTKPHVVLESNSLCVHRLQVLHCMIVWDGDDTHLTVLWSMYNVYESSAEPWVQCWRDGNGGRVYMHRDLTFLAWLQVATCKCCTATALMHTVSFDCENSECVRTRRYTTSVVYLWENSTGYPCTQKREIILLYLFRHI